MAKIGVVSQRKRHKKKTRQGCGQGTKWARKGSPRYKKRYRGQGRG